MPSPIPADMPALTPHIVCRGAGRPTHIELRPLRCLTDTPA